VGGQPPAGFTTGEAPPGMIQAVEALHLLEYVVDLDKSGRSTVRWELSTGPGGARILLTQTGPAESASVRTSALAGWTAHIAKLVADLADGAE
jgi:uncharacterized protein YndB with AHSA1/START domain